MLIDQVIFTCEACGGEATYASEEQGRQDGWVAVDGLEICNGHADPAAEARTIRRNLAEDYEDRIYRAGYSYACGQFD
jgi:hypothetical protein